MSPDEGKRLYRKAENNYFESQRLKKSAEAQQINYQAEKNKAEERIGQCTGEKINLEKRLEQIKIIIYELASGSVPNQILSANRSAKKANEHYHTAIVCKDSIEINIGNSFRTKGIDEDINTVSALQSCQIEKTRIENEITRLATEIRSLTATIEQLNRNINTCNLQIVQFSNSMRKDQIQMGQYSKFRYM